MKNKKMFLTKKQKEVLKLILGNQKSLEIQRTFFTHFCYSSPGAWRNSAKWYHLSKINGLKCLMFFHTEWYGDNKTRDIFFQKGATKSEKLHGIIYL